MVKKSSERHESYWGGDYDIEINDIEVRTTASITINEAAHRQIMKQMSADISAFIQWWTQEGKVDIGPVVDITITDEDSIQIKLSELLEDYVPESYAHRDAFAAMLETQAARLRAMSDSEIDEDNG